MSGILNPLLDLPAPLATGIAPRAAHLLCFTFTGGYVGSLYLAEALFGQKPNDKQLYSYPPPGHRDHPETMKRRMKAASVATGLALVGVYLTVAKENGFRWKEAVREAAKLLGLSSLGLKLPLAYALAPLLFTGPLYAAYLDEELPGMKKSGYFEFGRHELRNYVIAPITEELLFRSSMLAACLLGKMSTKWLISGTPLWFGIAHAHHCYQRWQEGGYTRGAAIRSLAQGLSQFAYTTLFGWFAAYNVLRTGSIIPAIVSHTFCNYMGIDLPTSAAQRHPSKKISIYTAYLAGIAAFAYGMTKF